MGVVKADAYGHGAIPAAQALVKAGVTDLAVATLEEAQQLRRGGINRPLLVLGGCFPGQEKAFLDEDLMPAILDLETAERLSRAAGGRGRQIRVHLKIDTGMGRVGIHHRRLHEILPRIKQLSGLVIQGVMSHLACADDPGSPVSAEQLCLFEGAVAMVRAAGIHPVDVHIANSAGIVGGLGSASTLVRPGIMLYGGLPGDAFATELDLKPVMHLRTRIAFLRDLPAGSGISYAHQFRAAGPIKVGVLPIGYADGYNRLLSNRGKVILRGQLVPVIGRVCMDWTMIDVGLVPGAAVGDCVTLMGCSDGLTITGDDLAAQIGSISYEVFCRIGARVPRRYL